MAHDTTIGTGARLKRAREAKGVSLRELADATKISSRALEWIERGDLSKLPGGIVGRGFVRSYAKYVGLDAEIAVAEFFAQCPTATASDGRDGVIDAGRRWQPRLPLGRLATITPAIAIVVYASFSAMSWQSQAAAVLPSSEIDVFRTHGLDAVPAVPAVRRVTRALGAGGEALDGALTGSAALTLELRANAPCWVTLHIDGDRGHPRQLMAGERTVLTAERRVTLTVGDAGALALSLNGRRARRLGADGEAVTTRISANNFHRLLRRP